MGILRIDQLFQKTQSLVDQGMQVEAVQLYLAYATQPASEKRHMALYNLGSLQQAQGDMPGAEASYRACISIDPSLGQAAVNLGLLLEKTGRKQEALEQWHQVANPLNGAPTHDIEIQTMAWNHIGRVYENHKQYDEAEGALERSLALNTKQTGVLQHWIHIRQKACAWPVYKPLPGITHNDMLMATSPLAMLAMTDDPVQQLLTAHAFVGRTYGSKKSFCAKAVCTHTSAFELAMCRAICAPMLWVCFCLKCLRDMTGQSLRCMPTTSAPKTARQCAHASKPASTICAP
jgi:predicted O-linked N-acetylglucosamine transferase (SPINDLY family)